MDGSPSQGYVQALSSRYLFVHLGGERHFYFVFGNILMSRLAPSVLAYRFISIITLENIVSTETFSNSGLQASGSRGSYADQNHDHGSHVVNN